MLPAQQNLDLYRGDSARYAPRLRAATYVNGVLTPGDYLNLTGCVPKAQIRATTSSAAVLVELGAELGDQATRPGEVILTVPAGATASAPDRCKWDFQLTHPDGTVRTYLFGDVTFKGQVTK